MTDGTHVEASKFEGILQDHGFVPGAGPGTYHAQTGFVKVEGTAHRALYLSRNHRVGRVDISGFRIRMPGVVDVPDTVRSGRVVQRLDMKNTEDRILRNFETVLVFMQQPSNDNAQVPRRRTRRRMGG